MENFYAIQLFSFEASMKKKMNMKQLNAKQRDEQRMYAYLYEERMWKKWNELNDEIQVFEE